MLKSVLVPLVLGRIERDALRAACAICERFGARLTALVGLSATSPLMGGWEYFPAGMYDTLDETAKAAANALAEEVREYLAQESASCEVRIAESFWLTPAEQSILHARVCDQVVLGRSTQPRDPEKRLFASVLFGSGRPLLVVPPSAGQDHRLDHVVIAWKPTREAARALHDALPFLHQARQIDLLTVGAAAAQESRMEAVDADVLRLFAQHGLQVRPVGIARGDVSSGQEILDFARRERAELIVAGGYGHSRAAEQVFGGVTRTLFEQSPIPVLFSH
jgi:nucleotide-binding universal stress UspA family protein